MTTPLSFHSEIRNTGITAYRVYVAEVSVSAPYALHIEFDGAAQASPVALLVEQKTDGTNYVTADSLAQSLIKGRRYVYDHDFPGEAWPKQVRITSPMPVLTASVSVGSASSEDVEVLKEQMATLTGENDTTPDIDTMREVKDFLAGMKQGDTIQQAINDSHADLSDEQMDGIKNLFPTK